MSALRAFNEKSGNTGDSPWRVGRGRLDVNRLNLYASGEPLITPACLGSAAFSFVADPFRVVSDGVEYVFVEAWNTGEERGQIAVVELVQGAVHAADIVLAPPFHLSYPCVFAHDGSYYMLPEAWESGALLLYKAIRFPWFWEPCHTLLEIDYADPQIHCDGGIWYIFLNSDPLANETCDLYWAESPRGPWHAHSGNPVVSGDARHARSAGPLFRSRAGLLRFTQNCSDTYGGGVQVSRVTTLSPARYEQLPLGPLAINSLAWASTAFHHLHAFIEQGHIFALFDGHADGRGALEKREEV